MLPSLPHTTGPMPGPACGSATGPTTAAPAPSAKMMAVERSVQSSHWESFSAPITSVCREGPARTASLAAASDAVRAGTSRHTLVIGAEKLSQWLDWTDRSTAIIFADGAGAAVVGPVADPQAGPGIGPVVWGSDGSMADKIYIKDRNSFLVQEGQAVFRWATTALHPIAKKACEVAGVDPADLAAFVPHQANLRIIESIARKLGAPQARVADDIVHAGNTSSASIPLALSRMIERGEIGSGEAVLLLGFGAGISYAAQVITVP